MISGLKIVACLRKRKTNNKTFSRLFFMLIRSTKALVGVWTESMGQT